MESTVNVCFSADGKTLLRYPREAMQKEYTIPAGVTHIGDGAFASCENLVKVVIPEGVCYVGRGAFADCTGLREVVLPQSLVGIKTRAFANCRRLKDLQLPSGLSWFEARAFDHCGCVQESGRDYYVGPYQVELRRSYTVDAPHGEYETFEEVTYYSMGCPPENRRDEDMYSQGRLDYWGQPIG